MRPVFSPLEKIVDVLRCAQLYLIIWTKLSLVVMANVVVQTLSPTTAHAAPPSLLPQAHQDYVLSSRRPLGHSGSKKRKFFR